MIRGSTYLIMAIWLLISPYCAQADVVKPALIEISVHRDGRIIVDMRASIEALLTGINARYKNTQEAPNAEEYDRFRVMQPDDLQAAFNPFRQRLISSIQIKLDGVAVPLSINRVQIPEAGYTKVPRISLIELTAEAEQSAKQLSWYYPEAFGDNAVRVRQVDEIEKKWHWSDWQWLKNDMPSEPFSLTEVFYRQPITQTILSYVVLGFEHILPKGLDHLLFIIGLFLFSRKLTPLLWQVTMFTLAHTLTLGIASMGWIELPARIVEPLIALSIAYIALENIFSRDLGNTRLALVFAFGLLHGLGFAGVLADFGLEQGRFLTSLLSFNLGVEIAQLAVVAGCALIVAVLRLSDSDYRSWVVVPLSMLIGLTGLLWTFERVVV